MIDNNKDMLTTMWDMQRGLQSRLGYDLHRMSAKDKAAYIKEFSIHLNQEINEALYELPFFKPWKDYSCMTLDEQDKAFDAYLKEMVDAFHFFLNMLLPLGITPEHFFNGYVGKNIENHQRQDAGYTHDILHTSRKENTDGQD